MVLLSLLELLGHRTIGPQPLVEGAVTVRYLLLGKSLLFSSLDTFLSAISYIF